MKLFTSAIKGSLTMLLCGVVFLGEIQLLAAIAPLSQEQLDEQSEHSSVNEATKPGATREVSGDKMAKRRRLLYVKGETEPFTGKVVATYVNGKEQGEVFSSPCEGGSKELLDVEAWRPVTRIPPLPGLQGHESIPKKGDFVKIYLKWNKNKSLWEPLLPNGIQIKTAKKK